MSQAHKPPVLLDLQVLQKSRCVVLTFDDGLHVKLPCAFLRVNSPSAETQGHSQGEIEITQPPKNSTINIVSIEPVGNYAIKFIFDDDHQTGLFTWEYLYRLAFTFNKI